MQPCLCGSPWSLSLREPCIPLPAGETGFFISFFVPLCQTNRMCLVTPVFLVVFGTSLSLNASQCVCEMAGIEFLVYYRSTRCVTTSWFEPKARILLLVQSVSKSGRG